MSLFEFKIKSWSDLSLPMEDGIDPDNEFELRSIEMSDEISPISSGIDPVKFELEMVSFWREEREERFDGMGS